MAAFGFKTTKNEDGTYTAKVTRSEWQKPTEILQQDTFPTRARATGFAKRWVLFYRREAQAQAKAKATQA